MKKDVYRHFKNCTRSWCELVKSLEKLKETGEQVPEERLQLIYDLTAKMKTNCDVVGALVYELNKPWLEFSKDGFKRKYQDIEDYFKRLKSDPESIEQENEDILETVRKYINEVEQHED